ILSTDLSHSQHSLALHPYHASFFFFLLIPLPPRSTLFPYTTLFRSVICFNDFSTTTTKHWQLWIYANISSNHPTTRTYFAFSMRSEEHTSELQSRFDLVCRLLLEKKKTKKQNQIKTDHTLND